MIGCIESQYTEKKSHNKFATARELKYCGINQNNVLEFKSEFSDLIEGKISRVKGLLKGIWEKKHRKSARSRLGEAEYKRLDKLLGEDGEF